MNNRKRNRLKGYDYSKDNLYFVTICVGDKLCCFGSVVGTGRDLSLLDSENETAAMKLNQYGLIIQERINWLRQQYEYVDVHNSVIMPNHVHLIVEIDSLKVKNKSIKIKSLSSLIGAFKTTSSKLIHESGFLNFVWHRSFHDVIIRSGQTYQNITDYIDSNPENWYKDSLFIKSEYNFNFR